MKKPRWMNRQTVTVAIQAWSRREVREDPLLISQFAWLLVSNRRAAATAHQHEQECRNHVGGDGCGELVTPAVP